MDHQRWFPKRRCAGWTWRTLTRVGVPGVVTLAMLFVAWAGTPRISLIEPFINNQVLVHFDTEANRTYILQYASSLAATSHWSNLYTGPALPFPNHYIVVDTGSAPQRFYRLSVTP